VELAAKVESDLGLADAEIDAGHLGSIDTFRFEERALLAHAGELICSGDYAKAIGIDPGRLLVSQPDCGEQALEITEALTRADVVTLIVIDSVAALVPRAEIAGEMGDAHVGLQARLMSQALRKLTSVAYRNGTTLLFINQLRQKIGVMFGSPETTTGGNALKFYASVRLDVRRIGKVTAGDQVVGNRTRVKVVKNKCAPPFCEAEFDIRWGTGIDAVGDVIETALLVGALDKNGSHLMLDGKSIGQGRERVRELLVSEPKVLDVVTKKTLGALPSQLLRCQPRAAAAENAA
jgi:recombination protein RecA